MTGDERRLAPGESVVGFIGLGAMGGPMARRLVNAGFTVRGHNRSRGSVDALAAAGATAAEDPADAAAGADAVVTMLPDTAAVQSVVTGTRGVLETLRPAAVLVDMSSIAPDATRELATAVAERGAAMLDAPVSGGTQGATDGTLSIMVGGEAATVDRCRPLLEVLGRRTVHVGDAGAGQVCKLCNQIVVGVTIQAVAEALTLADRAGVDPAAVREALLGGFAASTILDVHGRRMLERDFAPGGRASLHRKDLDHALALARSARSPALATALVHELFVLMEARGLGDVDHAGLALLLQ